MTSYRPTHHWKETSLHFLSVKMYMGRRGVGFVENNLEKQTSQKLSRQLFATKKLHFLPFDRICLVGDGGVLREKGGGDRGGNSWTSKVCLEAFSTKIDFEFLQKSQSRKQRRCLARLAFLLYWCGHFLLFPKKPLNPLWSVPRRSVPFRQANYFPSFFTASFSSLYQPRHCPLSFSPSLSR